MRSLQVGKNLITQATRGQAGTGLNISIGLPVAIPRNFNKYQFNLSRNHHASASGSFSSWNLKKLNAPFIHRVGNSSGFGTGFGFGGTRTASTSTSSWKNKKNEPFDVLFVGAGGINFGTPEGPWNHSTRLQRRLDTRLNVVGIIDPSIEKSEEVLKKKTKSFVKRAYENAKTWKDVDEARNALGGKLPDAIILGAPPQFRGTTSPGRNLESTLTTAFPKIPIFIEKPVSTDSVENAFKVAEMLESQGTLVSVGYFLRYLQVVQKAKEIITRNNLKVMATNARYAMAYPMANKWVWWDKTKQCGPIVEQATHLVDLSRYLTSSPPRLSTVLSHSLLPSHPSETGILSNLAPEVQEAEGVDSKGRKIDTNANGNKWGNGNGLGKGWIREEDRIERVTGAIWKYQSGAVGSLMHVVGLQGSEYSTELEIYADGWLLKLSGFYTTPTLTVRSPESDATETFTFPDDDPYYAEIANFIDRIDGRPAEECPFMSTYTDATETYALTWAIRLASEKSHREELEEARKS